MAAAPIPYRFSFSLPLSSSQGIKTWFHPITVFAILRISLPTYLPLEPQKTWGKLGQCPVRIRSGVGVGAHPELSFAQGGSIATQGTLIFEYRRDGASFLAYLGREVLFLDCLQDV